MADWSDMPGRGRKRSSLRGVSGGFMSVSGAVLLIGSVFVFGHFAALLADRGEDIGEISALASVLIEYRWLVAAPAAVAILCGIMLFSATRPSVRLALLGIGWMTMLMPIAAMVYVLIAILAPLYSPVEL